MANSRRPLESYPPEYLEFMRKGVLGEVRLRYEDTETPAGLHPAKKKAMYVRHSINQMRSRMKQEGHPLYETVVMMSISVTDLAMRAITPKDSYAAHSGSCFLVGRPRDSHVLGPFHAAGITAGETPVAADDPLASLMEP